MACVPDASFVPLWGEGFPEVWSKLGASETAIESCTEAIGRASSYVEAAEEDVKGLSADELFKNIGYQIYDDCTLYQKWTFRLTIFYQNRYISFLYRNNIGNRTRTKNNLVI